MIEMDDSEDNMSAYDTKIGHTPTSVKSKPKKRSIVERELETSLTAHFTSPTVYGEASGTSRYGRALRLKTDSDFIDSEKVGMKSTKTPAAEKTPAKLQTSPVYKMHASNSPIKVENTKKTPIKFENVETNLENQIENIYNENISLSRFGSSEKRKLSPGNVAKLYVRKDLIQKKEKEETIMLMKNMFSPRSGQRASNSHLSNVLERSSDKYSLNSSVKKSASSNGFINNSSVVKALDFDSNKKKKEKSRTSLSKSELFELEAKCEYQVGDLAWARMGTYPFWPCIVTREPASGMFVRKKLFGRIERDIIHVTFFGDNGRRSWIVDSMLRKFLGQLEFEATREHFSPTAKKRDPRLYAAFFVSEKRMPLWSISVEEAETLLREPKRLRIDIFNDMLAKSRNMKVAKSKSGKVVRTNSDVSLSESLYDTLFSENIRQSEESNGSRSKTRKSLDVSEVVTACLDNMAAKTGMTKIQKQSHMDRWLQKAKSKTPEKSQVKLQVPPKEKERVISSKKKRWEAPRNVPVKKSYSLRKSNESHHLMSQDNEHDYSSTPNEGELPGITFGIITKVESLEDKAEEREIKDVTPAKVDMNKTNGTCESPTFTQDYDDLIFAHEINTVKLCKNSELTLNSDVAHSDSINDINMSIDEGTNIYITEEQVKERSLEPLENNSSLNCIEVSNTLNVLNSEVANSDSVNDINMSIDDGTDIDKMEQSLKEHSSKPLENNRTKTCNEIPNNSHNMNSEAKQCSPYLHMNGYSEDIKNGDNGDNENSAVASVTGKPLYNSNRGNDHESKIDSESPNNLKQSESCILDSSTTSRCNGFEVSLSVESIENSDADTSIDNLSQSLEQNDNYYNFAKPVGRSKPLRKRSLRLKNRTKSNINKSQDDGFAKYVELRKDTIMDENPDLSEEEIMEYIRKTWQYQTGEAQEATQQEQRDKTQNGRRRRREDKQRDTIDNNEGKKIDSNSTKDKISTIHLQAEKKVCTVNLTDTSQDGSRRKEDKQVDTINNEDGKKIENNCSNDKISTIHLQAEKKVGTVNSTDNSLNERRTKEDKQRDIIENRDGKKIENNSIKDEKSTTHLQALEKVCTVNLTDKSQDGRRRKEYKQKNTIDNKDSKNIEKNSTNDKLSTIHLIKAEKKVCTVNLTDTSQDGRRKEDKQVDIIYNEDGKTIENNCSNDKVSTIHLQAEKKVGTVNSTDNSQTEKRTKEDKQRDIIENKDNKKIENNSTKNKISTTHLQALEKICTVNLTDKSQDGRRRKKYKQKNTIDNKDSKNIEKNSTNDKLSTIHLLKAEKKVCTVNLTDILRQNKTSISFKNGEKTCVLPVIKFNDLNKVEIEASNDLNESVVHNNDNYLINDKICNNLDCEISSCESLGDDIQTDRKDSKIIKIIKRKMENMDKESQRNVSLKSDVKCGQNNSIISSKIGELHNPDSEFIYITPDQHKSGNISELDSETSLPHRCLDKEKHTGNKETIDSTITVATNNEEESNDKTCDQNNTKKISKIAELHNMDSKSVYITPDQEKHNSGTVSELDLKTSLDHISLDNEKLSDNIETIDSTLIVATQNEKESLKIIAAENEDTTIDLLNKDSNIIEVIETKIENMDTETQFNVSSKIDKQCDQNNTIDSSKIVELHDPDSESVCITPDQNKHNSTVSELDLETSLHNNSSDNEKLSDNKETTDSTLTVTTHKKEVSLKSITTESEKTPIELLSNIGSYKLDTLQQKNDELNGQSNSSTSDKLQNGDSTKSEQNDQDISPLESEDSNTIALESTSPLSMNNLSNDLKNVSKADDNNLIINDDEVDSILKSIDNFVNGDESPIDTLDSDLQNGRCLELSRTINISHKEEEPTEMAYTETSVSVSQSLDNISRSHGEQSDVLNDFAPATEQTTAGDLKSITSKSDNFKVSNKNPSTLQGETSESEEARPQNVIEPTKVNGFYSFDDCNPDVSDGEFNAETSSIHSEDSEPLSVVRSKLQRRSRQKLIKDRNNPDFLKYVEIRQDALMDEHPELNQEEIIEYMYKTWLYEERTKSDYMKTDDIEQSGLVKGLNDNLRQKSIRNSFKKRKPKPISEDSISISSDTSDSSVKRRLRQRSIQSPIVVLENLIKYNSPERKNINGNNDCKSVNSDISENHTDTNQQINSNKSTKRDSSHKDKQTNSTSLKNQKEESDEHETQNDKVGDLGKTSLHNTSEDSETKKYFDIFKQNEKINKNTETKNEFELKVKEEFDPDTVSINSEDSEVSVLKRKQRKYADKQPTKDDPEFLKYVELRQDALMDEHPKLSEEEIISYLFKTWLYEESIKSDIKKSDELEQANLVKGLNTETQQPKKVKKKIKVEKDVTTDDDIIQKEKPKRKSSQPYYIEDDLSDSEDIEMFDIFKSKTKPSTDGTDEIVDLDEAEDVVDVVELYFSELTKPKPNVFKGLLREKVCEICEKTSNLVKCKGCNSMFHVDCVKKEVEVKSEALLASKGKKKKRGRKPKNLDESGSQSDEKSQEFFEDNNQSIEEIAELETYTVDAENFESLLEVKMKELISTEANYDTSFSDCGITWNGAVAGKCEIVDVRFQSKIEPDYSDFKCNKCLKHDIPVCFVCKLATSKTGVEYRQRCQTAHCYRYYHMECLDHWPQTQFHPRDLSKIGNKLNERFEEFMCPRHVCHTCVSDDPRGCKTRFSGDKLARCVKCPATYHTFTKCLPAGSQILTGSHIVCPRHNEHRPGKVPCHVNTGWCFICALGGSLICCEYCPTSFHAECLNIKPPEGGYMCEDCETGRLPLYGEMVWVKLGNYRWWPGLILHPTEIPDNIMAVKHSQGEFVVRFFGQYDHYWVNRGRVFPFQEGDSGRISNTKSKIDAAFTTAIEHAQRACEIMKRAVINEEEETDLAMSLLPPHYVKLKVNKPVGSVVSRRADVDESSLTQCDCSPMVDDPCGPYSHCLNRMLLTECGPSCRAGDRCNNRAFEKRLYPRMAPYKTPHRGWGLRTLEDIRAGQFVIEYVGELIDEEEFRRRMNRKHEIRDENFYFLTLDKERMIDAGPKGNLARFMNHCCEPNCETQKWTVLGDVRVGLFAINDIPANSELTFNYNLECAGIEKKRCLCGAKRCSGYMGAKPKQDEPKKTKRVYNKKRKTEESPSTSKSKLKRPVGRPAKPKELTEIEKDLIIIKNATNGLSSDSECSGRLSSLDSDRNTKALKRKRVDFSTEDSTNTKKVKLDEEKTTEVGD